MKSPTASYNYNQTYLNILIQPFPFVRKNMSLSLFQEISLTSNLNCSSPRGRCVLASMKVTTSSLLPTAIVWPSGLQHMLIFSPKSCQRKSHIWINLIRSTDMTDRLQCFTFGADRGHAFGGPYVPDADGLVSWCGDEQIRVGGMPAQLIHTVSMPSVVVFLHLIREIQVQKWARSRLIKANDHI